MVLLGDQGLLKDWLQSVKATDLMGNVLYKWIKKRGRFQVKNRAQVETYAVRLTFAVFYLILIFLQVMWAWKDFSRPVTSHTVLFITAYILSLTTHYVNWKERHGIVGLYNDLIDFELSQFGKDKNSNAKKERKIVDTNNVEKFHLFTKFLLQLETLTGICLPIVYHLDVLRNPCYPMYVRYWLSDQCDITRLGIAFNASLSFGGILTKFGISLMSYVNWSFLFAAFTSCHLGVEVMLHGHCFRSYISELEAKMWSVKKLDDKFNENAGNFRKIQVMLTKYRDYYSRSMLGTTVVCIMALETICLFNTIFAIRQGIPLLAGLNFLYTWCGTVCFFNVIFIFGMLADVYKNSRKLYEKLEGKVEFKRNKYFKRWLRSCSILRVYFGGSNYLEELTPLNMESFVINQTVSLLLLK